MKKILSIITSCMLIMSISISAMAAEPIKISSFEDTYKVATLIDSNLSYDEGEQSFIFDVENAVNQGLDSELATQIEANISSMSASEAAELNEDMEAIQPRSVVATVIAFLAGAGFSWLADKLLDYGAEKFCNAYGDYNDIAATACDMLGY